MTGTPVFDMATFRNGQVAKWNQATETFVGSNFVDPAIQYSNPSFIRTIDASKIIGIDQRINQAVLRAIRVSRVGSVQRISLTGAITGSGTTAIPTTYANNSITLAKFAQITADKIFGRATAGTGDAELITCNERGRELIGADNDNELRDVMIDVIESFPLYVNSNAEMSIRYPDLAVYYSTNFKTLSYQHFDVDELIAITPTRVRAYVTIEPVIVDNGGGFYTGTFALISGLDAFCVLANEITGSHTIDVGFAASSVITPGREVNLYIHANGGERTVVLASGGSVTVSSGKIGIITFIQSPAGGIELKSVGETSNVVYTP